MDAIQDPGRIVSDLIVIEDACQAHGAEYFSLEAQSLDENGNPHGPCSRALSFYPGKNLGACGEAGAATTQDAILAQKIKTPRLPWPSQKSTTTMSRVTTAGSMPLQAGLLHVKLASSRRLEREATPTFRLL